MRYTSTGRLMFFNSTTPPLPATVTAAQMQYALNQLLSISGLGGYVTVTQNGSVYTVTFLGAMQGSEDSREGPRAFAERRKPEWKGR